MYVAEKLDSHYFNKLSPQKLCIVKFDNNGTANDTPARNQLSVNVC
tara:strand:+ start:681 stop:818 length:138 start_codon:yes stop_codon:yes gene_type:complete